MGDSNDNDIADCIMHFNFQNLVNLKDLNYILYYL